MYYWYSPLIINKKTKKLLNDKGIVEYQNSIQKLSDNCLIIYNPPDKIIKDFIEESDINLDFIFYIEKYLKSIKDLFFKKKVIYIAEWRLNQIPAKLNLFDHELHPEDKNFNNIKLTTKTKFPNFDAFINNLTLQIIDFYPHFLSTYKDLELKSLIINGELDIKFNERLSKNYLNKDLTFKLIEKSKTIFQDAKSLSYKKNKLDKELKNLKLERNEINSYKEENSLLIKELEETKIELELYYSLFNEYKNLSKETFTQISRFLKNSKKI
tara:strand:- start:11463 stop:12269 length:807 start_codon:yes stop_codon:yes gene_type:complete